MTTDTIADQGNLTTANVADPAVNNDTPAATPDTSSAADPTTTRRQTIAAVFDSLSDDKADPTKTAKPATLLPKIDPIDNKPAPTIDPITGRAMEPMKPPASMSPALREKWNTVDPQFQKYWLDRERDFMTSLDKTTEDRKFAKEMRGVIGPHEAALRQYGTTAAAHIGDLLNLSQSLHIGTPQQRAKIIVQLTHQFKPDPQTMTALFNGHAVNIPTIEAPKPQLTEQQIADKVIEQRQQTAFVNEANTLIDTFRNDSAYEFFEDVRGRMSKLVSADLVSGNTPAEVYKNAYAMAVSQDKDIQAVLAERAKAAATGAQTGNGRQAPRSVKPSLGSGRANAPASKPLTSRAAALAAWEKHA